MGSGLGAEFVVGGPTTCGNAGHLAPAAGLVRVARDCGRRTGDMHRPERHSRRLGRVFHKSGPARGIRQGPSRGLHLTKRSEGIEHVRAVIPPARRRASVLWVLPRENRMFMSAPPVAQAA